MGEAVDFYCVAAEETKARLVARGAKPENVIVTGIPIAGKFSSRPDAVAVRKRFGLRDDLPTLLVLGGGFGMGPVAEILCELDKIEQPLSRRWSWPEKMRNSGANWRSRTVGIRRMFSASSPTCTN